MFFRAFALTIIALPGWSLAVEVQVDVSGRHQLLPEKLLRKESTEAMELEEVEEVLLSRHGRQAPSNSSNKSNNSAFDSNSGVWQEIRKKAKVIAEDPFSAEGPPTVIYTAQTASAAATLIMGMTTGVVGIFCLLHSYPPVQQAVWKTLDTSLSWFTALLIYYVLREVSNLMVTDEMPLEEVSLKGLRRNSELPPARSGSGAVTVAMMRFLISFACHQTILVNGRQRKVLMRVCSSFGAQLVGVLGADAFATWQETSTWNTPGNSFGLVCISVVIFAILVGGTAWLRGKAGMEAEHQEFCSKCDATVAATSISLVLIQFWRFFLAGRLPHFLGIQRSMYGRSETSYLFLTLLFLLATFLILEFQIARPSVAQGPGALVQSLRIGVKTLAYASAWCAFFWVQWFDHQVLISGDLASAGEVMKAEMYCTMAFSAFCMSVAIAGELSREKWPQASALEACFGQLSEVTCFAMCLTWNSAFQTACAFSKDMQASNFNQVFARCTQCQWMCILLIPSWLFFILPRVIANGEKSVGDQTADGDSSKEGDDKGTSNSSEKDKAPPATAAEADTPKPAEGVQSSTEAEPKSAPPTDPAPPEEEF